MTYNMGTGRLPPIRLLQTIGITSAAGLGSMTLANSFFTIPAILLSPSDLALRQWTQMYTRGKKIGPSLSLVSFMSFAYLTYHNYTTYANPTIVYSPFAHAWKGYALAGSLVIAIIPYTLLTMGKTVNPTLEQATITLEGNSDMARARAVLELAKEDTPVSISAATVKQLLDEWATLNLGRSVLGLAGAIAGLWTALA